LLLITCLTQNWVTSQVNATYALSISYMILTGHTWQKKKGGAGFWKSVPKCASRSQEIFCSSARGKRGTSLCIFPQKRTEISYDMSFIIWYVKQCRYGWFMSHVWISRVANMNESRLRWVQRMPRIWNESQVWMSYVLGECNGCHKYEWATNMTESQIWMSHVLGEYNVCHKYEWVTSMS